MRNVEVLDITLAAVTSILMLALLLVVLGSETVERYWLSAWSHRSKKGVTDRGRLGSSRSKENRRCRFQAERIDLYYIVSM